jgi:glycosyltransferase involved in cell wall biosynthesis
MDHSTPDCDMLESPAGARAIKIAVLVPCHNEAATVGSVVREFCRYLPNSQVYVYDNASTDATAALAREAGAQVRHEPLLGKGNVVRRMLADIEADVYVLVDGDGTYDAASAPRLVNHLLDNGLDMVNCSRAAVAQSAFRPGHAFGNRLLSGIVTRVFGSRLGDILSGYRVMSYRFVKSFPALSSGFEIETELTVHALELRVPMAELPAPYRERPSGSASKLRTLRDGMRILQLIFHLTKEERPLPFFSAIFVVLMVVAVGLGIPVIDTYLHTGQVPRLPTAVLATGLVIVAFLALICGLVLDTVTRGRRELKRLYYLQAGSRAAARRDAS